MGCSELETFGNDDSTIYIRIVEGVDETSELKTRHFVIIHGHRTKTLPGNDRQRVALREAAFDVASASRVLSLRFDQDATHSG